MEFKIGDRVTVSNPYTWGYRAIGKVVDTGDKYGYKRLEYKIGFSNGCEFWYKSDEIRAFRPVADRLLWLVQRVMG